MFDYMSAETAHIQTLTTVNDLIALAKTIKGNHKRMVDGPAGSKRPKKLAVIVLPGYALEPVSALGVTLVCSYGRQRDYLLAAINDTVVTYSDGTFCILPTGTPAPRPASTGSDWLKRPAS